MSLENRVLLLASACVLIVATPGLPQSVAKHPGKTSGPEARVYRAGEATPPVLEYKVQPNYPEKARLARLEGTVVLYIEVNPEGRAQNLVVIRSLGSDLDQQAILAVRQWKFKPGSNYGKPVTVAATVEINFKLDQPTARSSVARRKDEPEAKTATPAQPSAPNSEELLSPLERPKLVHEVEPVYPTGLPGLRREEAISIRMTVDTNGVPRNLEVVQSSEPRLEEAAMAAVREWRYEPGKLNGKQVELAVLAEVHFHSPKLANPVLKPTPEAATESIVEKRESHPENRELASQSRAEKKEVDFFGSPQTSLDDSLNKLSLRSENFRVVSDWKDQEQLGQMLLALERARALFLHLYDQVPTGVVTALVHQNVEETRAACQTSHGVGCYSNRAGSHSITLSKDAFTASAAAPAVHEYTHLAQSLMGYAGAPPWVNEGIAGYYENVEIKKGKVYVGYFDPRRVIPAWLHIDSILAMDYNTLNKRSSVKTGQAFYAQSHLLVHMLRHTPKYNARLGEFLGTVKKGTDSPEAFRQLYGISTSQLNDEFVEYYRRGKYQKVEVYEGIRIPNAVTVDGSGQKVTVKEKKCSWCSVGKVLRHIPIIIPI